MPPVLMTAYMLDLLGAAGRKLSPRSPLPPRGGERTAPRVDSAGGVVAEVGAGFHRGLVSRMRPDENRRCAGRACPEGTRSIRISPSWARTMYQRHRCASLKLDFFAGFRLPLLRLPWRWRGLRASSSPARSPWARAVAPQPTRRPPLQSRPSPLRRRKGSRAERARRVDPEGDAPTERRVRAPRVRYPWGVRRTASAAPPAAPPGMLLVPGGTFTMGLDKGGQLDEVPAHSVTLSAFSP